MTGAFGTFDLPVDGPGWAALFVGLLVGATAFVPSVRRRVASLPDRPLVLFLAALAAALSAGYVVHYLGGGPRIIDATAYFLQARALGSGDLAFDVPDPSGSFRGRFLLFNETSRELSGIFPPGYPALLAFGFVIGAPLAVGPALAALLVVLTHRLALRLFDDRSVALLSAALSVLSAALRYHTADTMSHGWSAVLFVTAVLAVLGKSRASALGAGLAVGWLLATRPITGLVAAVVAVAIADRRRMPWLLAAFMPGIALLALHQHAATGDWFSSTQLSYYALADGPPGCFRYGFGSEIGCLGEHGDFVRSNLPDGYGPLAAVKTTLRRIKLHLLDVANFEVLGLLLPLGAFLGRRERAVRLLVIVVLGIVVGYAPFYFDGNYPGGGARMLSDVLPFEHVALAWTLGRLTVGGVGLSLSLLGFALHASHAHVQLENREGGRPMFEPRVLEAAGVRRGLVFVDTDHGFLLGHDPEARVEHGWVVARYRGDDHDTLLHQWLGAPPAYRYHYDPSGRHPPSVAPFEPVTAPALRFEMEAEWPPLAVAGGSVRTDYAPCASGGRALSVVPEGGRASMTVEIAVAREGSHRVETSWLSLGKDWAAEIQLAGHFWRVSGRQLSACFSTQHGEVKLEAGVHPLTVRLWGGPGGFDAVHLKPLEADHQPGARRRPHWEGTETSGHAGGGGTGEFGRKGVDMR